MTENLEQLNPNEAAEYVGETPDTLTQWRRTNRHLPYQAHPNGTVSYLRRDLDAWNSRNNPCYVTPKDWAPTGDYITPATSSPHKEPMNAMNQSQVAEYLEISAATVSQWVKRGVGPSHEEQGRRYRYMRTSVDHWLLTSSETEARRIRKRRGISNPT